MNSKKTNVYLMSDPHYGHLNLCRGVSSWTDKTGTRDFPTVESMNHAIVKSINDNVGPYDTLICLGDWSFGGINNIYTFWSRLICNNLYLVPGNHDHHIKADKILPNSEHEQRPSDLFIILPELFKFNQGKDTFILCHYPLEQWEDMDKGSIHIHGHMHHGLDESEINRKYRRIDVGWTPEKPVYLLDDIIAEMKTKDIKAHNGNRTIL